jgi:uncharacterized protein
MPCSRRLVALLLAAAALATACSSGDETSAPTAEVRPGSTDEAVSTTEAPEVTRPPTSATSTTSTTPTTTTTTPPAPPKSTVPPVFAPSAAPPRPVDASAPLDVFVLGDSTAFSLGWGVKKAGEPTGLVTARIDARTSTGLTRRDYFDWPFYILAIMATPPEVAVVSFGANDSQPLQLEDGSYLAYAGPGWREEYARRVDSVMRQLTEGGVRVYWVGQPIARDPAYSERMALLNSVYAEVVAAYPGATYVDAWHWLSDDAGAYTDTLPDGAGAPVQVRTDDGIHLNTAGGDYLGGVVVNRVLADYGVGR